jgi:hypothetical protein
MAATILTHSGRGTVSRNRVPPGRVAAGHCAGTFGQERAQVLVRPDAAGSSAEWPFETALLLSAMRCVIRYVGLPFVLPLAGAATSAAFGVGTGIALGILLTFDIVAGITVIATLRRLWRLQHPHRWLYLPLALALAVLVGFFFVNDTRLLDSTLISTP